MSAGLVERLLMRGVTPCNPTSLAGVTGKATSNKAVPRVTPVTPEIKQATQKPDHDEALSFVDWHWCQVTCGSCRRFTANPHWRSAGECSAGHTGGVAGVNATLSRTCPDWRAAA